MRLDRGGRSPVHSGVRVFPLVFPCCQQRVPTFPPAKTARASRTTKALRLQGFLSAPREIRTPTTRKGHKALNLARLPVPPQARSGLSIDAGVPPLDVVRGAGYSANTCSD